MDLIMFFVLQTAWNSKTTESWQTVLLISQQLQVEQNSF